MSATNRNNWDQQLYDPIPIAPCGRNPRSASTSGNSPISPSPRGRWPRSGCPHKMPTPCSLGPGGAYVSTHLSTVDNSTSRSRNDESDDQPSAHGTGVPGRTLAREGVPTGVPPPLAAGPPGVPGAGEAATRSRTRTREGRGRPVRPRRGPGPGCCRSRPCTAAARTAPVTRRSSWSAAGAVTGDTRTSQVPAYEGHRQGSRRVFGLSEWRARSLYPLVHRQPPQA